MGTNQEDNRHVIQGADLEKYRDLLVSFVYNFPGSTPAHFAQEQLKEIERLRLKRSDPSCK